MTNFRGKFKGRDQRFYICLSMLLIFGPVNAIWQFFKGGFVQLSGIINQKRAVISIFMKIAVFYNELRGE